MNYENEADNYAREQALIQWEREQEIASTMAEWDAAEAAELGAGHPERCWILTGVDVWHRNPYYRGTPRPHPEDEQIPVDVF